MNAKPSVFYPAVIFAAVLGVVGLVLAIMVLIFHMALVGMLQHLGSTLSGRMTQQQTHTSNMEMEVLFVQETQHLVIL